MKARVAVCFAFAVGVLLGVFFHPSAVEAQFGAKVYVKRVQATETTVFNLGSQVVGFSCTRDEDGRAECYVATK